MGLREWYRQQGVKARSNQEEAITPARSEEEFMTMTTTRNEDVCSLERDNSILFPESSLFSSSDVSPRGPTDPFGDHSTNQIDDATCNDVAGNDHSDPLSPLFTSASISPQENLVPVHPQPPSDPKKLVETVSDEGADIVPLERNHTPSTTNRKSRLGSEKEKLTPPPSQIKRQDSKTIKKRKISPIEVVSEDEVEEDQPPLKRVKLQLGKAPTPSSGSGRKNASTAAIEKVALATKPKSVTAVKTLRMIATVVWPNSDKPVFDQVGSLPIFLPP
jgi:hypothetical protein